MVEVTEIYTHQCEIFPSVTRKLLACNIINPENRLDNSWIGQNKYNETTFRCTLSEEYFLEIHSNIRHKYQLPTSLQTDTGFVYTNSQRPYSIMSSSSLSIVSGDTCRPTRMAKTPASSTRILYRGAMVAGHGISFF